MRFDKKSRKIRPRKKNKKGRSSGGVVFYIYLGGGLLLLALFLYFLYGGHRKDLRRVQLEKIREDMDRICVAAILFYQDHGRYPDTTEGLQALLTEPSQESSSTIPSRVPGILERVPLDPWRTPYRYQGPEDGTPLIMISLGADRKPGGEGEAADVVRTGCESKGPSGE